MQKGVELFDCMWRTLSQMLIRVDSCVPAADVEQSGAWGLCAGSERTQWIDGAKVNHVSY
jgi:adenine deaminase